MVDQVRVNIVVDGPGRSPGLFQTSAAASGGQDWSLTQFYSVDFSQSRLGVKKCVFNKRTIKV